MEDSNLSGQTTEVRGTARDSFSESSKDEMYNFINIIQPQTFILNFPLIL